MTKKLKDYSDEEIQFLGPLCADAFARLEEKLGRPKEDPIVPLESHRMVFLDLSDTKTKVDK